MIQLLIILTYSLLIHNTYASDKYSTAKIYIEFIPKSVEVTKLSTIYSAVISRHITESLFSITKGYEVVPELVKNHSWNKDSTELTITLKDTTFSNGIKLNTDHVINSLSKCIISPTNKASLALSKVVGYEDILSGKEKLLQGIVKLNETTLKIKLREPAPLLIDELAMGTCNIWQGKNDNLLDGAIGTGPYIISSFDSQKIILTKRKEIKNFKQVPQKIIITNKQLYKENKESYDLFESKELLEIKGFTRYTKSTLGSHHLVLNNSMPPYNDVKNRKLIKAALDYKEIQKHFNITPKRMQRGLISYGARGFKNQKILSRNKADILKMFNKAGYNSTNKIPLHLHIRDTPEGRSEKELWQNMFRSLPIDLKIIFVETSHLFNRKVSSKFMAMRVGKAAGSIDPFRLFASYHSNSTWNTAHSNQKECDKLIEKGLKVINKDLRYDIYQKIDNCLINEQQILIPLFTLEPTYIYLKKHWKLRRKNRFIIYPLRVYEWLRNEK